MRGNKTLKNIESINRLISEKERKITVLTRDIRRLEYRKIKVVDELLTKKAQS
jgi:hypothetical protein